MSKKIGPDNPPRKSRFQKGKSGNPKGRPKNKKNAPRSPFDIVLDKELTVRFGSVVLDLPPDEAIQLKTLQKAFDGNQSARREVMRWIKSRDKEREKLGESLLGTGELLLEGPDPDNANEALKLLGVVTREPSRELDGSGVEHLLIERWVAQMALSRRRGGEPLTEDDIALIKCEVREHESLRWPRSMSHDE